MSVISLVLLSLLAAICSCDITMFGQFMISRPIFSGALFGYILGDMYIGLWIGMIIEMLWINELPMGSAIPVDLTMMTILSVVWTLISFKGVQSAAIFALVLAIPFSYLYREVDVAGRLFNTKIMHWVENGIENGKENRITLAVIYGLLFFLLRAGICYFVFFTLGGLIYKQIYAFLPMEILFCLKKAWFYLPVFGFGVVLFNFRNIKFPSIKR